MTVRRKLIEVALPLEAINKQSAREKSIRHGHPATLHLWWARRPLATARAVLFAQLVDDPSAREDEFRADAVRRGETEIDAYVERRVVSERERLFDLITRMVDWDNLNDETLFDAVRAEIRRSTNGNPPAILDPFAGGGTIPLEAQRLGLEAHASDLNPVSVLINKALIDIPPTFAGQPPVFPGAAGQKAGDWPKATGLAEDVRRYGRWMRDEAVKRIGNLYPKATLADGSQATVIAWIWARTVTCPNPACGIEMPLVRSWWLGKRTGKEAYIVPAVHEGRVSFAVSHDAKFTPALDADGTIGRAGAICLSCSATTSMSYIRAEGQAHRIGYVMMATVASSGRGRVYLSVSDLQRRAADVNRPVGTPPGTIAENPRWFAPPSFGMTEFSDLFTNRQLTTLTTLTDLVGEARAKVVLDATLAPRQPRPGTPGAEENPIRPEAYADAIATYLGMGVSRTADIGNSLATWSSSRDQVSHLFTRHAIPMAWDFTEVSPFASAAGDFAVATASMAKVIERLPASQPATAHQSDASTRDYENFIVSTDPPYYDNIGYSDLSDFFYVWLRSALRAVHPKLFSTMLVPKDEELVANPYRHDGTDGAKKFFENGFEHVFERARTSASSEYPITVYYAFKQSEADDGGESSTGWETLLGSMIRAGWLITATWPVRSERTGRMISIGTNALASSIVLALRPRPIQAPIVDRRGLLAELKATLPDALRELQQGAIAPVDLAQAAIGPGMAIFSKYSRVIEPAGGDMSVRDALQQINIVLDEVLSQQEGDFDRETRWCLAWFEGHGFETGNYGEAETLANAKSASVAALARSGILSSGAGKVRLFAPADLPGDYDPTTDDHVSLWEITLHLARALGDQGGGLAEAGRILARAEERGFDMAPAHELAYRLFALTEKKGLVQPGILFNALGSSWPELRAAAKAATDTQPARTVVGTFDFDTLTAD
ncbi:DUF1156 domain-containing protein [Cryobacterium sp. PH31-L1]|uniref:DUF1156 domain-containing protein n=1 Tax=Cryobacterium sp. PH31-L1 TaxID=3046199 RepID=UPI0024BB38E3|nr:DUF1156 domain-containing protein [Cryobacterium sp. PH31-L1]MDJ0378488.1 DUF1156 domain-containing protein [Cryobacterium sp. PH31-L1]